MAVITNSDFLERSRLKHGFKYEYLDEYVAAGTKLRIKCTICDNIFSQRPADHWAGHGCSKCAHAALGASKRHTNKEFLKKAKETHGDKYIYLSEYQTSKTKIEIKCKKCNLNFSLSAINHYRGRGCPSCTKKAKSIHQRTSNSQFIINANKAHNSKYIYLSEYRGVLEKITIQCLECNHVFRQLAGNHLSGSGCPECKKRKAGSTQILTNTEFLARANKVHSYKYTYPEEYKRAQLKISINCSAHGVFNQTPNNHLNGQGCPVCSSNGFDPNKPAVLYYMLDRETGMYKIGITNGTIETRFGKEFCSIRAIALMEQSYDNGQDAYLAEQEILQAFKAWRCTNDSWPLKKGGRTEFFTRDILELNTVE